MVEKLIENLALKIEQLETVIRDSLLTQKVALSFEEAKVYLGISESQLYKLTSTRKIPCYKPGGKLLYFRRMDLDNWILSNRRMTSKELKTAAISVIK
jgi:excisionase family DNA binding protein